MMVRKSESKRSMVTKWEVQARTRELSLSFWMNPLSKEFKDQTLATSEDRLAYIEKLEKSNKEAILGTMVTDSEGICGDALKGFYKRQLDLSFCRREEWKDYDLAAPQYSSEMKARRRRQWNQSLRIQSMKDDYTKSAKISIKKQMSLNKDKYVPEVRGKVSDHRSAWGCGRYSDNQMKKGKQHRFR